MPRRKASKTPSRPNRRRQPLQRSKGSRPAQDDILFDDEDSFHANRDKILLEGEEDDGSDDQEEEVLALQDQPDSDASLSDQDEDTGNLEGQSQKTHHSSRTKAKSSKPPIEEEFYDSSEEEGWGKKKSAYYATNAGDLEEEEETNELYLEEALRLQRKAISELVPDDFGIHDHTLFQGIWETTSGPQDQSSAPPTAASLKSLEKVCPEVIALARDWDNVMSDLEKIEQVMKKGDEEPADKPSMGLFHLYHQTLLQYTSLLAYFFYLYTVVPGPATKLRKHPILPRLLLLREASLELEDLGLDADLSAVEDLEDLLSESSMNSDLLDTDFEDRAFTTLPPKAKKQKTRVSQGKKKSPSNAIDTSNDLVEPIFVSETRTSRSEKPRARIMHFGDATELQSVDAQDKKARKKSIQFHAARIDNSQLKRTQAVRSSGGDDDLPYPESRKQVLARRPEPKYDSALKRSSDLVDSDEDPSEDYYRLIKKQKKEEKEAKKTDYDTVRDAERAFLEPDGSEGPRSITRAILANKGLTPKRAKTVRNPRVKKRMKFEKAKQKLSSQKAVYKGGQDASGYGGERTGISVRTVKSVKFS